MQGGQLIDERLRHWATIKPTAISIREAKPAGQSTTYAELLPAVIAVRRLLGKPKTVIVALPGGVVNSVLWLACLSGGHRIVPISPDLTAREYDLEIKKHKPDFVVTDSYAARLGSRYIGSAETVRLIGHHISGNPTEVRDGLVFLSTSGSTGKPKGIILTAAQCVLTAQNIVAAHGLSDRDRCLTPLPFYHVNAPIVSLLSSILSGGQVIITPKYSTEKFWSWVENYDPTWISIVPTMAAMLLSTARPSFLEKSALRFVRTASAPLPVSTLRDFEKRFGLKLIETYGISEAASTIFANPAPPGKRKAGSVGLPAGVELEIRGRLDGKRLASEVVGEVWVKGDNVISSYVDNVDPGSFRDGWFKTGDLGRVDKDGYLYLTGRSKDIIIRGGENIFPREIEEVVNSFPAVREAVVVGHPDELYGEKVIAYVLLNDASENVVDAVKAHAKRHLSRHKVPSEIYVLAEFPKTRSGKVDKVTLRKKIHNARVAV